MVMRESVSAILLAAGESTRMGRLKQLLPWDGRPLILWQVQQLQQAGAGQVIVVLGYAAAEIEPSVDSSGASFVINDRYHEGRASSLRAGAAALAANAGAVIVASVDQPRPAWLVRKLIDAWRESRAAIVVPRFAQRRGHPVLLDATLLPELATVSEEDLGLRAVMQRHYGATIEVSVDTDSVDVDLNLPADYDRALASFNRDEWREPRNST